MLQWTQTSLGFQNWGTYLGAESLHCYHYLHNEFNGQSFSLDCQMMQLYLLLCFWPNLIHMLETESKIFISNQCSGSHTGRQAACEDKEQECCRCSNTRWFKYDQDWFVCKQAALFPVLLLESVVNFSGRDVFSNEEFDHNALTTLPPI